MALTEGRHPIGPDTGSLHLTTTREGMAAKVGHDLLIAMQQWSGHIGIDDDGAAGTSVQVEVDMDSFEILSGSGGITPLSADDRDDITKTALRLLDAAGYPRATFDSTRVVASDDGGTLEGELTVRGATEPLLLSVAQTGPASWRATATVLQSSFGIKPYRALFGALKLADPVGIEVTVDLSGS
jgi:polyisoprenoid-binding protein YceI